MTRLLFEWRLAARGLIRSPLFSLLVVSSLALGLGATMIAFRAVDTAFLRSPAGVGAPEQLRRLYFAHAGELAHAQPVRTSYPAFLALRDGMRSTGHVAAYSPTEAIVGTGEGAASLQGALVSENFFSVLRMRPQVGRLVQEEDRVPMVSSGVVISDDYWARYLGRSRNAVGVTLEFNGRAMPIIGVAPPGFTGLDPDLPVHFWVSTAMADALGSSRRLLNNGSAAWVKLIVRGDGGPAMDEALQTRAASALEPLGLIATDAPGSPVTSGPLLEARGAHRRADMTALLWVAAVAVLLLLTTCANIAGLALARAIRRRDSQAIRLALGARTADVVRGTAIENVLLLLAGGAGAFVVGLLATPVARLFGVPRLAPVDSGTVMLLGALVLAVGCAFTFGPTLHVARVGPVNIGRQRGHSFRPSTRRAQSALLVGQTALACALISGTVAFGTAFRATTTVDLGFDPAGLLAVSINGRAVRMPSAQRTAILTALQERTQALPGVRSASLTSSPPFHTREIAVVNVRGGAEVMALGVTGDSGYFQTLGMRLLEGRAFDARDGTSAPLAIVVNDALARELGGPDRLAGQCVLYSSAVREGCATVVGVVGTAKFATIHEEPAPAFFIPVAQSDPGSTRTLLARSTGDERTLERALRSELRSMGVVGPAAVVQTVASLLDPQLRPIRSAALVFAVLGILALVVAATGVYGVVALMVAEERRNIGIRMALGASTRSIAALMICRGVMLSGSGAAIGVLMVLWLRHGLESSLPAEVRVTPGALLLAIVATLLVGAGAAWVPARQASRVDPAATMRDA